MPVNPFPSCQFAAEFQLPLLPFQAAEPENPLHKLNLAALCTKLGSTALRDGDLGSARRHHQRALELRLAAQALDKKTPGVLPAGSVASLPNTIADSYEQVGNLALLMGDPLAAKGPSSE